MDLHTISSIVRPTQRGQAPDGPGDAWLAGGSWLFSEPQPELRRLFDLQAFDWPPLTVSSAGLEIAATCTIATLHGWSGALPAWTAASIVQPCCRALLGSFKVWNVATVGGNLCLSLPAGPMTALAAALDGECLLWGAGGEDRRVPALDFVTGDRSNVLRPGEMLRSITLPHAALRRRAAVRQISLSPLGRSGALLVGTRGPEGDIALTITASTRRPHRLTFPAVPELSALQAAIDGRIGPADWFDDVHGRPAWRRHVTQVLAAELLAELAGGH